MFLGHKENDPVRYHDTGAERSRPCQASAPNRRCARGWPRTRVRRNPDSTPPTPARRPPRDHRPGASASREPHPPTRAGTPDRTSARFDADPKRDSAATAQTDRLHTNPKIRRLRSRPPYTILAFVAVVAATIAILVPRDPDPRALGGAVLLALLTLGLWQGIWLVWLVLTLVTIGDVILVLSRADWWGVVLNATLLALLLAAPTRRHARRGRPRAFLR